MYQFKKIALALLISIVPASASSVRDCIYRVEFMGAKNSELYVKIDSLIKVLGTSKCIYKNADTIKFPQDKLFGEPIKLQAKQKYSLRILKYRGKGPSGILSGERYFFGKIPKNSKK